MPPGVDGPLRSLLFSLRLDVCKHNSPLLSGPCSDPRPALGGRSADRGTFHQAGTLLIDQISCFSSTRLRVWVCFRGYSRLGGGGG